MPKVRGPLFSLAASGTLLKTITFMDSPKVQMVRFNVKQTAPRSPLQQIHGKRVADCRASWRTLSQVEKDKWQAHMIWSKMTGPALFMREWFAQNIFPPALPVHPA